MKFLYCTRVFIIGFEFLLIVFVGSMHELLIDHISLLNINISSENDVIKWLILLPFGTFLWNLKEARIIIGFDNSQAKLLLKWPSYWKIKYHVFAAIFYSVVFLLYSIFPWLFFEGVKSPESTYIFLQDWLVKLLLRHLFILQK